MIPYYSMLTNRFENIGVTNVWIQMDLRPVLYDGAANPVVDTNDSSMFYVDSNGYFVVHDGIPTNWYVITNTVAGSNANRIVEGDWVRLDLYQDYSNKTWTMFADYQLMKQDIGFVNTNVNGFTGIEFFNGASTSYLDNVEITTTNPPDT